MFMNKVGWIVIIGSLLVLLIMGIVLFYSPNSDNDQNFLDEIENETSANGGGESENETSANGGGESENETSANGGGESYVFTVYENVSANTSLFCGDGIVSLPFKEQCESTNDHLCPGLCNEFCKCLAANDELSDLLFYTTSQIIISQADDPGLSGGGSGGTGNPNNDAPYYLSVRAVILNIGGESSGPFFVSFKALSGPFAQSEVQDVVIENLNLQEEVKIILSYGEVTDIENISFEIEIDPTNQVEESNEDNNNQIIVN